MGGGEDVAQPSKKEGGTGVEKQDREAMRHDTAGDPTLPRLALKPSRRKCGRALEQEERELIAGDLRGGHG